MKIKILLFILCIFFLSSAVYGQNVVPEYHQKTLDNGATIISSFMPDTSLVTIQIRVLSGLSNEGIYAGSGISHFLEHLLFKGTMTKTGEQLRNEIKQMGGIVNGSTDLDSAEYHIVVPADKFEEAFDLISDMVMDPVFSDKDVEVERQVILNEIRLRKDDPMSNRMMKLFGRSYKESVYRYPIIGEEEKFLSLTRDDIINYHINAYTTDRVVIGIAGGVKPERAIRTAEEKFAKYDRHSDWESLNPQEPLQKRSLIIEYPEDVTLAYMSIGFHTTSINSPDLFATDVLSLLLGEGDDSRLYKRLVKEKRLLYNVSTVNYTPKYPGLFIITGIGAPDKIKEARKEILNVIEELKVSEIDPEELTRARNLILSRYFHSTERSKDMISTMTDLYLLTGDIGFIEKYVNKLRHVGTKEIKDVLYKYLTAGNSNTVILLPSYLISESVMRSDEVDLSADRVIADGGNVSPAEKSVEFITIEDQAWNQIKTAVVDPDELEKKVRLGNGLTVVVKRNGHVPLVSVVFSCQGGLRAETVADSGIANLTAALFVKGTYTRDEAQIKPVIERLGGSLAAFSGMNSLGVVMDVLSENFAKGMDVFEDVVKNASFPEGEIDKEKEIILAMIKEQEKSIFDNGLIKLKKLIYQGHPYSLRILGTERNVESFTRDDIKRFYDHHFSPSGAVLSIVGDVDPDKVIADVELRFKYWKGRNTKIGSKGVPNIKKYSRLDIDMNKEQSLILIGYKGVTLKDKRKYTLDLVTSLLSGSDGVLFKKLREREGLVYTSGVISVPEVDSGYIVFYAATGEQSIPKAKSLILDVIEDMNDNEFLDREIEASKNMLVSQQAFSIETNHSLSMVCALDELYGLGYDDYKKYPEKIKNISRKDLSKTIRSIFEKADSAEVIVHSK